MMTDGRVENCWWRPLRDTDVQTDKWMDRQTDRIRCHETGQLRSHVLYGRIYISMYRKADRQIIVADTASSNGKKKGATRRRVGLV